LEALANSKIDLASWPPSDMIATAIPWEGLEEFTRALVKKGNVVNKQVHKQAVEKARLALQVTTYGQTST